MKVGTILVLGTAIVLVMPPLKMPAVTQFIDGSGPVFAGKLFPFAFITIACGAVSGFHALIASGTTPKLLRRESDARLVGYGGMLTESLVGVMAMVAAAVLDPGVYFAINVGQATLGPRPRAPPRRSRSGDHRLAGTARRLDAQMGESSLRHAPAAPEHSPSAMARILGGAFSDRAWRSGTTCDHFEAVFILTTIDAGNSGRPVHAPGAARLRLRAPAALWYPSIFVTSILVVVAWGYFLYQGVIDPSAASTRCGRCSALPTSCSPGGAVCGDDRCW